MLKTFFNFQRFSIKILRFSTLSIKFIFKQFSILNFRWSPKFFLHISTEIAPKTSPSKIPKVSHNFPYFPFHPQWKFIQSISIKIEFSHLQRNLFLFLLFLFIITIFPSQIQCFSWKKAKGKKIIKRREKRN